MTTCPHDDTVPVEVVWPDPAGPGHAPTIEVVARLCVTCHDRLPAGWGCTDCEWVEDRRLCDPAPTLILARPWPTHQGAPT